MIKAAKKVIHATLQDAEVTAEELTDCFDRNRILQHQANNVPESQPMR